MKYGVPRTCHAQMPLCENQIVVAEKITLNVLSTTYRQFFTLCWVKIMRETILLRVFSPDDKNRELCEKFCVKQTEHVSECVLLDIKLVQKNHFNIIPLENRQR